MTGQIETVETIEAWAVPTFGPSPNLLVPLARAGMELAELITRCAAPVIDSNGVALEAADVGICLCRPASMLKVKIDFNIPPPVYVGRPIVPALAANGHLEMLMTRVAVTSPGMEPLSEPAAIGYLLLIFDKLHAVCATVQANLGEAISAKMVINRARKWRSIGDGIGEHIKEGESA